MSNSHRNALTDSQAAAFFLSPDEPLQRQYEALRAFFVEQVPSHVVARRFGYSPGAFRVLCHQFRHDPEKRSAFFQRPQRGPRAAPPATPSASGPWPCASAISRSTTFNANWLRPASAQHQCPDGPAARRGLRPLPPPPRRGTPADPQTRRRRGRRHAPPGSRRRARFAPRWPACSCSSRCWRVSTSGPVVEAGPLPGSR